MIPQLTVCTGFILMKKNLFKCCVTWKLMLEDGPPSKAHGVLCRLLCRLGFIQKGFGNLEGEFRLGNDYLHRLIASATWWFALIWRIMKATNHLLSTRFSLRPTTVIIIEWRSTYTEALQGNHCNFTLSPSGMIWSLYFPGLTWINTDVGKPLKCTCLRMRQRSLTEESWRSVHLICLALSSKIVLFMIEPYSYK